MKINFKSKSGMTLVELMVYLAITMIVSVLIIELTSRMLQAKTQSAGSGEVAYNATLILDRLTYEISNASAVTGEYPADTLNLTVNGAPIIFELNNNQILYQGEALSNNLVEISHVSPDAFIFDSVKNGEAESIKLKFKVKFKNSNFSRDCETSVFVGGK